MEPIIERPKRYYIFIPLSIIMILVILYQGYETKRVNDKVSELKVSYEKLQNEEKAKQPSDLNKDIDGMKSSIQSLLRDSFIQNLQHEIEGAVVTDNFVVNKLTLTPFIKLDGTSESLTGIIDLELQPPMNSEYQGQGKFNVQDRDLKGMLQDITTQIGQQCRGVEIFKLPKWSEGVFTITVKNYEVGTLDKGTIKLKGE